MNDVGPFLEHPFVEVPGGRSAVLTIRTRLITSPYRRAASPRTAHSRPDGIADQHDARQGLLLSAALTARIRKSAHQLCIGMA